MHTHVNKRQAKKHPASLTGLASRRHDVVVRADSKVGGRIKSLRLEHGLSQRDLAGPGLSYAYISRIEAGARTPSLSALIELADALDTSALWLATGRRTGCPFCGR